STMGMIPMGMIPMGMIPQPKSKLELAKEQSERDFIVKKGGWICYNCQKANYSYVGSCSCGMSRNESEKKYADKKIAVAELEEKMAKDKEEKSMALNEKVWECLTCHHLNKDSAKICKSCGQIKAMGFKTISPNNCPGCGYEIETTDKFCNVCGYKLKTED
ncbi:MAG: zinc ribbon domain-containing protein, partial [Lachnospiraceae bacterium]|nr:zinc ribbon domain-containing protein [Lachnospiraceae bacterium]